MNTKLKISICALIFLLLGLWLYTAQLSTRSTTFAGPEFHARDASDNATVFSDLTRYLGTLGFHTSTSPSELDSWAGVHSEGSKRLWFAREEERNQKTHIYIDHDEQTVRTSVKWEVYGSHSKAESAEREAYALALDLDSWFERLPKPNSLPTRFREAKRQDYKDHLANNEES
jgi:hypothetical protein